MDRISALRNVEESLATFENGEIDLETVERRVQAVVRTYATEYSSDGSVAYRVETVERADVIVVASSSDEARNRAAELLDESVTPVAVDRLPE